MLLKILTHPIAGCLTFSFDDCFVKLFQHVSSVIILRFFVYELLEIDVYEKIVDTFAPSMLTTRYTSKKYSCYDLVVILHQKKGIT